MHEKNFEKYVSPNVLLHISKIMKTSNDRMWCYPKLAKSGRGQLHENLAIQVQALLSPTWILNI
jgi:hypothetical protein